MNNYKLTIQYDGTNYAGWQIQKNAVTIQQKITDTLTLLTKEEINLIGSGRTDSGVHAFGQAANFRSAKELDPYLLKYQLNSILPSDISIISIELVAEEFHARFDAVRRSYFYFFSKEKSPFYYKYTGFIHDSFDVVKLNELSKVLIGEHDFTSFCRKNTDTENKICTVHNAHWREQKGLLIFYIEANRFLHSMVRTITGTIINTAKDNYNSELLLKILNERNRESAWESVPAKGLFLNKVTY